MIDKLIEFLYKSLFFITPLLFVPITSELFEFNKMLFIYIITILIGFFWFLKMILSKKIIFKKTVLDIPILIFLISQILSTIFSIDKQVSLFGYYGRFNGGLISLISYIFLYYGFVANSIKVESILKTSLFSSFLVILYALPGKLGHDLTCIIVSQGLITDNSCWSKETNIFDPADRVFSTLGQPNWFGAYLVIHFFIGAYYLYQKLFFDNKDKSYILKIKNTLFPLIYLFFNFILILFSRSRSALLAIFIGFTLFIIYYLLFIIHYSLFINSLFIKYLTFFKRHFKKLLVILLLVVIFLFFKTNIKKSISNLFIPTSNLQSSKITDSSEIRKIVWQGAINLGLKYPFFGTGVETFAYSYYFTRPKAHNLTSEWDFIYNKAHNEFLNYLATTGFIGLGSYLIMIGAVLLVAIRQISNIKYQKDNNKKKIEQFNNKIILTIFLLLAYISILITNFFGFSTTTINLFFYLIPAFLLTIANNEVIKKDEIIDFYSFKLSLTQKISIIFLLFTIYYLLFTIFKYWYADTLYAKGLNYFKSEKYQVSAYYFEKALSFRQEPVYQDKFSLNLAYLSTLASYEKKEDLSKKFLYLSDYFNLKTLKASPKSVFYWKTRAKNLFIFYQLTFNDNYLDKAIESLKQAEKLAPTDPKIPYSLAFYYSFLYTQAKSQSEKNIWKEKFLLEINKSLKLKDNFQDAILLKENFFKKISFKD